MKLAKFPRLRITHGPTPLEPMKRLSDALGGPNLWIKRDDCTGLATGGNKTRKLEFLMARGAGAGRRHRHHAGRGAVEPRAPDRRGRGQARHAVPSRCWRTAPVPTTATTTTTATCCSTTCSAPAIETAPAGTDMNAEPMAKWPKRCARAGGKPYVIPGGGSNPVGALGYVTCALELMHQANDIGLRIDRVVHATGSAGTQAGLVVGLEAHATPASRCSASACGAAATAGRERLRAGARRPPSMLGVRRRAVAREDVVANCDYVGAGYGIPDAGHDRGGADAGATGGHAARPGVFRQGHGRPDRPDPQGPVRKGENVVFLHTGGAVGLFGYMHAFQGLVGRPGA